MARVDDRYFKVRKILANEKPKKQRPGHFRKARSMVYQAHDRVDKLTRKKEKTFKDLHMRLEKKYKADIDRLIKKSKASGKPIPATSITSAQQIYLSGFRRAYDEAYYEILQEIILQIGTCIPDIDSTSVSTIRPGYNIELLGTCFGPSQGKVLFEIRQNELVELEVISWSETRVVARLNSIIAEVPLRPYYGSIWIQTGTGSTSNVWPLMYEPMYTVWAATWVRYVSGGLFGKSINSVLLSNRHLGDTDFNIEEVDHNHQGDGWSKKQSPYAGGQSLAQGYHIGMRAFKHGHMSLMYMVKGPKGFTPTHIPTLGPWGFFYDTY
jgi:hypothetical protein